MPGLAIVALLLTDHTTRSKALWVGGVDVIKDSSTGVGVGIETVEVVEAAPGGCSSITFSIDDPNINVILQEGQEILFWDITNDVPIFRGWVQHWAYRPAFGNLGRVIDVQGIGVEAFLDWSVMARDMVYPQFAKVADCVQSAAANALGYGQLRALQDPTTLSRQAAPTSELSFAFLQNGVTVTAGTTLREALRQICADFFLTFDNGATFTDVTTIDFYWGLRLYQYNRGPGMPTDWTRLTVVDTSVGAIVTEDLSHEVDAAGIVRGVYVQGGNAAGSGPVSDGSGKPGAWVTLSDSTITTAARRDSVGAAYLSQFALTGRGEFSLIDHSPVFTIHAGGIVRITDTRASQATIDYPIGDIRKTFSAVRQTWTVSYGGREPSAINAMRRLTRAVTA